MGLVVGINGGRRGWAPVGFFGRNNLAASQSNIPLGLGASVLFDTWVAPAPCRVVAISYHVDSGSTLGTVTVSLAKNGSDAGVDYDDTEANATDIYGYAVFATPLELAAGDRLGVLATTSANWNGTSGDITALPVVEFI